MFSTFVLTLCLSQGAAGVQPPAGEAPAAGAPPSASQPSPASKDEARTEGGMTLAQAEALALTRSLAMVAARLDLDEAEVTKLAASLLENPELTYQMQNIVLGDGNAGDAAFPSTFQQVIQTVELSQVFDVWFKKRAHVAAAQVGVEQARWQVQDALREVRHAVQSAFVAVLREQRENDLARQSRVRYDQTVVLTQKRYQAGDISETELRKIELEQLKYVNSAISAGAELAVARADLAALMAYGSADALPATLTDIGPRGDAPPLAEALRLASEQRPDLQAARLGEERAMLALRAEKRSALPDLKVSGGYTHSKFQLSGDNPETLLFSLSVPIPLFDRNQADIAAARVDIQRAANVYTELRIATHHDVRTAHVRLQSARGLLDTFEHGMVERAERALAVAERSYRAGALSLLELLEAQRTYLETRADYLQTLYDWRQASIDLAYAVGSPL